ncbi:MAG: hypothetical protein A3C90_00435 [Candidatus Magasanikbacteria bacterium RIFCSPHIGHO2_02_FULL_51_14]|uniref:DUF5615 domain-containing protein n=1 Tax=Candidatus Magasanikbacteria bacterium RIFCSPHIGHO2_02_FULL_51_14 TaxID=1798683 RepID=A0A1F6ME73_9BACT|nr:MAG: hypothetical protein A3C90_00435 [Candidatus Magasanikbacteria bacterium RIFCSPHIGHO2_02_FULL_51_14]
MRYLIDENVRYSVCERLTKLGHDVVAIADIAPSLTDEGVLELSAKEQRILLTNDADFGMLIYRRRFPAHGIVLFRLKKDTRTNVLSRLEVVLRDHGDKMAGHFIIISENQIRVRPLKIL